MPIALFSHRIVCCYKSDALYVCVGICVCGEGNLYSCQPKIGTFIDGFNEKWKDINLHYSLTVKLTVWSIILIISLVSVYIIRLNAVVGLCDRVGVRLIWCESHYLRKCCPCLDGLIPGCERYCRLRHYIDLSRWNISMIQSYTGNANVIDSWSDNAWMVHEIYLLIPS